jgi:hypothetical protein
MPGPGRRSLNNRTRTSRNTARRAHRETRAIPFPKMQEPPVPQAYLACHQHCSELRHVSASTLLNTTEAAMSVPYANASSGHRARQEVEKILLRFGCEKIGFMDHYAAHEVLLHFEHRGRVVQLHASAKGWAAMWMKANPRSSRARKTQAEYQDEALNQGHLAVSSILRDWIKGQVTAIECGILSFEAVFMPFMLTSDGRPLLEKASELLPAPTVISIGDRRASSG